MFSEYLYNRKFMGGVNLSGENELYRDFWLHKGEYEFAKKGNR
jgi:hypothetical protein